MTRRRTAEGTAVVAFLLPRSRWILQKVRLPGNPVPGGGTARAGRIPQDQGSLTKEAPPTTRANGASRTCSLGVRWDPLPLQTRTYTDWIPSQVSPGL